MPSRIFEPRRRPAGRIAPEELQTTRSHRAGFAASCRTGIVSRGVAARENFHFRRHRPATFCRRAGRADACAVWPQLSGTICAGRSETSFPKGGAMSVRTWCKPVPEREFLSGGHFTGRGAPLSANARHIKFNLLNPNRACHHHRHLHPQPRRAAGQSRAKRSGAGGR